MSVQPRAVIVTRRTPYEMLLRHHATREQARFFLESRGRSIDEVEQQHRSFGEALADVRASVPRQWRSARVDRDDLDRFLFEPEDVVVVLGQDGLVANVAKYLSGQVVVGLSPDPGRYEGILVPHDPARAGDLLAAAVSTQRVVDERTLVQASLDDGQTLLALNEVFVGHRSHQTARYRLSSGGASELQFSSGVIVSTGTGSTGWARSINQERGCVLDLPSPDERRLVYFVREAFPAPGAGTTLTAGELTDGAAIELASEMDEGGVIFGDGIEADHIEFPYGSRLLVAAAGRRLRLLVA